MDTVWEYTICAANSNRLLMRVAQILDTQFLIPLTFQWTAMQPDDVKIVFQIECAEAMATRMRAKLLHLHDVTSVLMSKTVC